MKRFPWLVAFDMDGVLVDTESTWTWIHRHFGVSNERSLARFINGEIDDHEFMRSDIALWLDRRPDLDIEYIESVLGEVPEMQGIERTVRTLRENGARTVIISGGLDIVARRLADKYGFDGFMANGLEIDEKGRLTGRGILRVRLMNKREALNRFLEKWRIPPTLAAAVGNSFVDASMFEGCSHSIAFNPVDPEVIKRASAVLRSDDLSDILPLLLNGR